MIDGQSGALSGILKLGGALGSISPALRGGETVTVSVLRRAESGRWVVLVRGRTLTASSDVPLSPGSTLEARVSRAGSSILLRLNAASLGQADAFSRLHLPGDAASRAAARALLSSGLGVTSGRLDQLRGASAGSEAGRARRLRLAAEIIRKLPGLSAEDVTMLTRLMDLGEQGEEEEGGRRRRRRPREASSSNVAAVREGLWRLPAREAQAEPPDASEAAALAPESRSVGLLRLFNHLATADESWIVLPCRFAEPGGPEVVGSLRVLYSKRLRVIRALVLGAAAEGGPQWWFHLVPGATGLQCRVFRDGEAQGKEPALLETLRVQMGNLGVRIADTVEAGSGFDGFSPGETCEPSHVDIQR